MMGGHFPQGCNCDITQKRVEHQQTGSRPAIEGFIPQKMKVVLKGYVVNLHL